MKTNIKLFAVAFAIVVAGISVGVLPREDGFFERVVAQDVVPTTPWPVDQMPGPAGPVGPQGPRGDVGPAGATGPKGDTGVGAPGPQGTQGPKGDAGSVGVAGPQGPQGGIGATGPQGAQGIQGEPGPRGATGLTGDTGPQGPKGNQGDIGPQGPIGATGPQGSTGAPGSANNVQFTGAVTLGALLAVGQVTKDITVSGILATDRINVMPMTDMPAGVVITGGRVTAANTVRLYFNALSVLTDNTPKSIAITALR